MKVIQLKNKSSPPPAAYGGTLPPHRLVPDQWSGTAGGGGKKIKIDIPTDIRTNRWSEGDVRFIKRAIRETVQNVIPGLSRDLSPNNHNVESGVQLSRQTPARFPRAEALGGRGDNFSVSLLLTANEHVREINLQWRKINKPTNVLSFPSGELENAKNWPTKIPLPLGDIVMAYETAMTESKTHGIKFSHYVSFLAVHGTLHLLGYDHETDDDHERMMRAEIATLLQLRIANPYPIMQNTDDNA